MSKRSSRRYELVNLWPLERAKRELASATAAAALAAEELARVSRRRRRAPTSEVRLDSPAEPAAVAGAADGEVPAGFMRLGSELIRIGRDDLAELGRRQRLESPFGRDGG